VKLCLAIDQGTTDLKLGFVTLTGEIAWSAHVGLDTDFGPNGQATQDADAWWDAVRSLLADGLHHVDASSVAAVCCTGMWSATVPVDADGNPVGPASTWLDTQGREHSRKVIAGPIAGMKPTSAVRWLRKTGAAPSTSGADPIGHMLHLRHDLPAVHAAARWYLEPVDHLNMRFTGRAAASHASMVGAWLTDNRRLDVLRYDDDLVRLAGVDPEKLPPLLPVGSVVGSVRDGLGLPTTAQVITGLPDLHTAAVGTGCVAPYATHLAISTSSWISCPVPFKKTDITHQIASLPGLRPGEYLVGNNHETAGRCLQWFRDTLLPGLSYDEVTALAASAPAGSGNVLFTPWLVGERSPVDDRNARAGFHNVSIEATQGHLARAVLEGVAFNARWLHAYVERFCKRRLDPIRIFGGGAESDLWCQIHADVMDRTIERVRDPRECGLRGAAIFAGLALCDVRTDEVASLVDIDRTFTPDPTTRSTYDRLYAEFEQLHSRQKKMFKRLNAR
jgi:xylulokinase